ncbi:hypothetical protein EUA98_18615 [Pengzhenrongella frigida]|uniref:Uncharacterized protein n=1 Tax=Pengzhenrongella frigida TaxID=1259133 RepID=A0A4Q5MVE2_9MICO|nr:hypothetical protein EUA98_18615 [Cellulomonas sp. HLT2-17]
MTHVESELRTPTDRQRPDRDARCAPRPDLVRPHRPARARRAAGAPARGPLRGAGGRVRRDAGNGVPPPTAGADGARDVEARGRPGRP